MYYNIYVYMHMYIPHKNYKCMHEYCYLPIGQIHQPMYTTLFMYQNTTHYQLLPLTTNCYRSPPITTTHYQLLPLTIYQFLPPLPLTTTLTTSVQPHSLPVTTTTHHYIPITTSHYHTTNLPLTTSHYQLLPLTTRILPVKTNYYLSPQIATNYHHSLPNDYHSKTNYYLSPQITTNYHHSVLITNLYQLLLLLPISPPLTTLWVISTLSHFNSVCSL